jgi:putative DNA-invertase from lambdoid prophage Rac
MLPMVVAVFEEQISATARHRPEWEKLKLGAHRAEFNVLVIAAIDRLGRSMVGNLTEILNFDRMGIEVVSAREPWLDMGGPVRELLIGIFSWLGQEERRQLADRSKAGVERARREGKTAPSPGPSPPPSWPPTTSSWLSRRWSRIF